ncbi:MAG: thiamine biosynthesis protein [Thermodesulfobacteriota bacterium]
MTTALALFSGGLDSILACRLVASQGLRVVALRCVTPFFGYDLLAEEEAYREKMRELYGIEVALRDVSEPYLAMLRHPPHGYGKNFNPCVDCKILLMRTARETMAEYGAELLISGEVLGQRPMSQRLDTLRVIERDSGCEGLLVRPLCAKGLAPTKAELAGLIDREQLLAFRGRSRQPQMELAARFGITDYPSPAGGCVLTDPIQAQRIASFYAEHDPVTVADIRLLLAGRHFRLPHGGWLAMGRREEENDRLLDRALPTDWVLTLADRPGPTGVLRFAEHPEDFAVAAGLVARYGRKGDEGAMEMRVLFGRGGERREIFAIPLAEAAYGPWRR